MKTLISNVVLLIGLTSGSAYSAANCDTDCNEHCSGVFIKEPCKAACAVEQASDCASITRFNVVNACDKPINIALEYIPVKSENWKVDGWWNLKPGKRGYLIDTKNQYIYLYAESADGSQWTGDHCKSFRGKDICMFQVDTGSGLTPVWLQTLRCN